jgi:hypothetical protein
MIGAQPRMPRQHRAERPWPGVLGPHRRVPGVHHHRHPRLGEQAPHRSSSGSSGENPPTCRWILKMRAPASSAGARTRHPWLGVERRRRQAPRRGLRERQRPRVQVGGHVRPVRVGQRAEHPHAHGSRRCATRSSSLHLYRIGQLTPTSGPAASKYSHTRRSIRGGRKCVWIDRPAPAARAPARTPGCPRPRQPSVHRDPSLCPPSVAGHPVLAQTERPVNHVSTRTPTASR